MVYVWSVQTFKICATETQILFFTQDNTNKWKPILQMLEEYIVRNIVR